MKVRELIERLNNLPESQKDLPIGYWHNRSFVKPQFVFNEYNDIQIDLLYGKCTVGLYVRKEEE